MVDKIGEQITADSCATLQEQYARGHTQTGVRSVGRQPHVEQHKRKRTSCVMSWKKGRGDVGLLDGISPNRQAFDASQVSLQRLRKALHRLICPPALQTPRVTTAQNKTCMFPTGNHTIEDVSHSCDKALYRCGDTHRSNLVPLPSICAPL